MTTFTKQTVVVHNTVLGIPGESVVGYNQTHFPPQINEEFIELLATLFSQDKTDNIQHNPLIMALATSGIWLNKYNYATGVRLWVDEASALEYLTQLDVIFTKYAPTYDYSVTVENVDPEVLSEVGY